MRRIPLILISLLAVLPLLVAADPLCKGVDDKDNVHYSDKPQPGAQKIELPPGTTYKAPVVAMPTPAPAAATNSTTQDHGLQPYTAIVVSSPKDQDTIWNTTTVSVSVALTPALQPGATVTISVEGKWQTGACAPSRS